MPEAPAQQDTPIESAPTGTPDPAEVNYQKRYDDLRPQFDRTTQEAAQLRAEVERVQSDPEYQRQLMAAWGYEVEEPEAGGSDPGEELRSQLQELQQWREQTTQEQQQSQQLHAITSSVDEQFRGLAPDLDESTREWVTTRALNMDPREDGMPDIKGAIEAFQAWEVDRQKQWAQTKRRAPHIAPGGSQGTQAPDLDKMNPSQLAEWMAEEAIARSQA